MGEDVVGIDCVAHRGGGEAEHALAALVRGDLHRRGAEIAERVYPGPGHGTALVEMLGQPEGLLVGERRQRGRTAMGINHEQVARVGADVEDAETHASKLLATPWQTWPGRRPRQHRPR